MLEIPKSNGAVLGARARVVAVRPSGASTPFFFLHGDWLRGAFFCFPLASRLGADQPFYVSHPYELSGLAELPSIEMMAAEHLRSVRSIQPEGPYVLGGFCNGALLAHEMALQLQAQGQMVNLLVMMDPMEPFPRAPLEMAYRLMRRLSSVLKSPPDRPLDWFLLAAHVERYLRHAVASRKAGYRRSVSDQRRAERLDLLDLIFPHLLKRWPSRRELRRVYQDVFTWIACAYRPASVFSGKIAILWNSGEPRRSFRRMMWTNLTREKDPGDITVRTMAGSHNSCKTDDLPDMAHQLRACLEWIRPAS